MLIEESLRRWAWQRESSSTMNRANHMVQHQQSPYVIPPPALPPPFYPPYSSYQLNAVSSNAANTDERRPSAFPDLNATATKRVENKRTNGQMGSSSSDLTSAIMMVDVGTMSDMPPNNGKQGAPISFPKHLNVSLNRPSDSIANHGQDHNITLSFTNGDGGVVTTQSGPVLNVNLNLLPSPPKRSKGADIPQKKGSNRQHHFDRQVNVSTADGGSLHHFDKPKLFAKSGPNWLPLSASEALKQNYSRVIRKGGGGHYPPTGIPTHLMAVEVHNGRMYPVMPHPLPPEPTVPLKRRVPPQLHPLAVVIQRSEDSFDDDPITPTVSAR
jgi:hypothetical protein